MLLTENQLKTPLSIQTEVDGVVVTGKMTFLTSREYALQLDINPEYRSGSHIPLLGAPPSYWFCTSDGEPTPQCITSAQCTLKKLWQKRLFHTERRDEIEKLKTERSAENTTSKEVKMGEYDIMDLIPSKTMQKAIKDEGRVFTDSEKASFIFNCSIDDQDRDERLKKLLEITQDEKLKKEINERFEKDRRFFEEFKKNDGAFVFYAEIIKAKTRRSTGYKWVFADYDYALEYSKHYKNSDKDLVDTEIRIYKYLLNKKGQGAEEVCGNVGYVYLSKRDYPNNYWIDGGAEYCANYDDKTSFESRYVPLPNPFDFGDRVKIIDDREIPYYVMKEEHEWFIAYKKEDWIKMEARIQDSNDRLHSFVDWSDVSLPICYGDIEKDYMANYQHINPIYLEKI